MTIIAWDGKTLAADREAGTTYIKLTTLTKIQRLSDGSLVGIAGPAPAALELLAWVTGGAKPEAFPGVCRTDAGKAARVICISREKPQWSPGVIAPGPVVISVYEDGPYPLVFDGPIHAIGAGTEAALAAMLLGHDARKAVEIANMICNGCGGGIDSLELDQ